MPPEILKSKNTIAYSFSSDIWSFAMILYELMSLQRPFQNNNLFQVTELTLKGTLPPLPDNVEYLYSQILPLWKSMLDKEPTKRPSIVDVKSNLLKLLP